MKAHSGFVQGLGNRQHHGKPNAILMACAPDLLSALERLAQPLADDDDLDFAREVIRRAKGQ
jgi:hypothetical protein